jgi:hypothetical protein
MPRPIEARIDLAALRHNYLVARRHAAINGGGAKAWAVVKANAYGHGLLRAAAALARLPMVSPCSISRRRSRCVTPAFASRFCYSKAFSRRPIWPSVPSTT